MSFTVFMTILGLACATLVGMGLAPLFLDLRSSEEKAIEATVEGFAGALGSDGETACLQLSRGAQARLMRRHDESSCERAAESAAPANASSFDFGAIRFVAGRRRARVLPEGVDLCWLDPCSIPLEEGDGRWRITGLEWYFAQ